METVNDIINEIRRVANSMRLSMFRPIDAIERIADRLGSAYKRDMQSMVEAGERDMERLKNNISNLERIIEKLKSELGEAAKWTRAELSRELAMNVELNNKLREENARLTVALKPVLECDTKNLINVGTNCINAVVESKRIYNGGAK